MGMLSTTDYHVYNGSEENQNGNSQGSAPVPLWSTGEASALNTCPSMVIVLQVLLVLPERLN